ncbi:MAG: Wzz/FepE/Etk N-terminal domain-containing protein [Syntrophales bacterium]|nr:Wzz/FepE/Etk N-terminal domain-containing protein [Syntrophales bacterium]
MTENRPSPHAPGEVTHYPSEDEIDLYELWIVIWKYRKMIAIIVFISVLSTAVVSLFMPNIYRAQAVIVPITKDTGSSAGVSALIAAQFGALPGISLPGSATAAEIMALLKSNVLREKMITQFNLLPVLFSDQWDEKKNTWKKKRSASINPLPYINKLINPPPPTVVKKDPHVPDTWDGLRALEKIIKITQSPKEGTITVSAEFKDPEMAAHIVEYLLRTLTDHMSSEAKRVATTNKKYLEEQLATTSDPLIKQKTYALIAQQIELSMMAEVKENFAFKLVDPPKIPDLKIKPKRLLMVSVAFVSSLFVGIFLAFLLNYIENTKKRVQTLQSGGVP